MKVLTVRRSQGGLPADDARYRQLQDVIVSQRERIMDLELQVSRLMKEQAEHARSDKERR